MCLLPEMFSLLANGGGGEEGAGKWKLNGDGHKRAEIILTRVGLVKNSLVVLNVEALLRIQN